ncbi:Galactose oxidase/kelch, beta-propeller [Cordyceps militaris CM01]|uniref:Galactose oxidase/kelch, beta-propeller n=1 Tax=Cordyceps militaris (strain CM01) TaxID=983644 RepID=G3J6I0_CORMM|nr:Galactose oxidase/kelch, beta-propeller [Cordyceps militaris CM01]EGX96214.1 Galactose oxidase/kelch, beta-propeller [Cordyceps militaris CM01]
MKSNLLAISILPFGLAHAQFSDWAAGQINTTICFWNQPRAALVRDKIYIDGGSAWWTPGYENGTFGKVVNQGNGQGIIVSYDLSKSFGPGTNVTGILLDGSLSKARGGKGNANGDAPVYYDGALLGNDAEFFLYGGAVYQIEVYDQPASYEVLEYQAYAYGPDKPLWKPGFNSRRLPDDVTRYIAYGGAASAPSENKAWYFSGLSAPSRGPMVWNAATNETRASTPSNTLITLDMANQLTEKWTNTTLPSHIKPRANPEVVWVPVGEQGILVVLGGATYPEWASSATHKSSNKTLSVTNRSKEQESPAFMSTIDIYDVANSTWYQQPTTGGPGTRTRGCAVVAPAADRSSFNIYYYGGFDGVDTSGSFPDDVWVLSLPSFTWTKISDGIPNHGRAGHKCFLPYPDQMMIVGGYTGGSDSQCLGGGPVVLLNLTSGAWMDHYDPTTFGTYGVHDKVQAVIGGNSAGHATATAPTPSGWATPALGNVFANTYDVKKMKTYWPYNPSSTNKTGPDYPSPAPEQPSKGVPNWMAPILGVVLGLVLITGSLLVFCVWRRRVAARKGSVDASSSHEAMSERLFSWAKGHNHPKPTDPSAHSAYEASEVARSPSQASTPANDDRIAASPSPECHEMENTQIAELGVELHGADITATEAMWRRAGFRPIAANISSFGSLRSVAGESPIAPSNLSFSGSDASPSSPRDTARWGQRKLSVISSVSFQSGDDVGTFSRDDVVSPIGRNNSPTGESEGNADHDAAGRVSPLKNDEYEATGMSPLKNAVIRNDCRRRSQ